MRVEVDQSGKVEQKSLDTVIALTNGNKYTVLLRKSEKRILEKWFKQTGLRKYYPQIVFSILVAKIIVGSKVSKSVLIDTEYMGHNEFIKMYILKTLLKLKIKNSIEIKFGFVGKMSKADYLSGKVRLGKIKPDKIIIASEIKRLV